MSNYTLFVLAAALLVTTCLVQGLSGDFKDGCPRRPHPEEDCPNCKLTTETSGYLVDPCNATCYYQCWKGNGEWMIYEPICCPCCTYFNLTLLTCAYDPDAPCETPQTEVKEYACTLEPCNDPTIFLNGNVSNSCPEGTIFKEENCTCIHDPVYPPPISMNYTIRNKHQGKFFEYTIELATTRSPFIVMIRLARKLYTHFRYKSKVVEYLGDYIMSVNGVSEIKHDAVWMFLKKLDDGSECIPDIGINQYRVHDGEHLILSLLPTMTFNNVGRRCP